MLSSFRLSALLNNAYTIQWPKEALQYHPHAQNCVHGAMWCSQRIAVDSIKTEINALFCESTQRTLLAISSYTHVESYAAKRI